MSQKQYLTTDKNYPPVGAYSPAIIYGDLIYMSGQIGLDKNSILLNTIEGQLSQIFENIDNLLIQAHSDKSKIIKCEIYLKDINQFNIANEIYSKYFEDVYVLPVRTTVEVSNLPKNALIEISIIAHI